jgi:HlyD family secretion protein
VTYVNSVQPTCNRPREAVDTLVEFMREPTTECGRHIIAPQAGIEYPDGHLIEQQRSSRKWLKRLAVIGFVLGAMLLLRLTFFRPQPVPVTVHRVDVGLVEDTVVNSRAGTIESRRRSQISPGVAGLVVAIPAAKGARVKKGDLLLRLNDREHKAQAELAARALEAARAVAEQARLEADHAERQWQRAQDLARNNVVSETAYELDRTRALTTKAGLAAAQAHIQEAEAALESARALLEKTVITAPFDGVVLNVSTEVGEWISPSPPGVPIPPVLDLIDPAALYLSAPIDEADVARIRVGLPARITLDAFRGKSFKGTLTYVSSYVETRQEQNRTLRVEAVLEEAQLPANVLAGLSADIEVILDARDQVVRVPTYALLENNRVLVVENGRLHEKQVNTGLHNWSYTEIISGVTAGELVVVSLDRPEVKPGARVILSEKVEQ